MSQTLNEKLLGCVQNAFSSEVYCIFFWIKQVYIFVKTCKDLIGNLYYLFLLKEFLNSCI